MFEKFPIKDIAIIKIMGVYTLTLFFNILKKPISNKENGKCK